MPKLNEVKKSPQLLGHKCGRGLAHSANAVWGGGQCRPSLRTLPCNLQHYCVDHFAAL